VAAGNHFSLALKNDGTLWEAGGNGYGFYPKYGLDDNRKRTRFVRVLSDVAAVAASADGGFSLAIKTDGTLWGIGSNGNGALGTGDYADVEEWREVLQY
jgi:alpha-tubulin suppressor-like RCC1 family protein